MSNAMIAFKCKSASELLLKVTRELCREGYPGDGDNIPPTLPLWETVGPRGMGTRELRNTWYRIEDVRKCAAWLPGRNLNYPFMVAEWLWMYLGRDDVEMISYYNSNISKFSDDGEHFFGAYGPRWRGQVGGCIQRLRSDRDSRQAVLALWRQQYNRRAMGSGDYMGSKDVPCTMVMQYMIRKDKLETSVCMRSSDAWLGLPYDMFNFSMLQMSVAAELQLEPGPLTLYVGSSHLYDSNLEQAKAMLERWDDPHAQVSPAHELVMPEVPRVYNMENIVERENQVRHPEDNNEYPCSPVWHPWISMLHHRATKDPIFVMEPLRVLVQP